MRCVLDPLHLSLCNYKVTTGYGKMAQHIKMALQNHTPVSVEINNPKNKKNKGTYGPIHLMIEAIGNCGFIKPDKTIIFTMHESSIVAEWILANLLQARMIITPSKYCKEIFSSVIRRPVVTVPLGVDTMAYRPQFLHKDICTFGIAGTITFRKNVAFVVQAFNKAFHNRDVVLKIKTTDNYLPKLKGINVGSKVEIDHSDFSEYGMCYWYNSLDALISCTHSEGFGLHQLEAMACGIPVISPKFGGVTEFFDESVGYCVDYNMTDASGISNNTHLGEWSSAIESSLIEKMREVYDNRERAKQLGILARKKAEGFTWDRCAISLIKKINNHLVGLKLA